MPISSRKRDHVDLVVERDVSFRSRTTGLERYELEHNALPEIDFSEVDPSAEFLGVRCSMPLLISSMTGGYDEAERINAQLGEVCESMRIPMGVGSQRQAIRSDQYLESFRSARRRAPSIAIFGNIGGAEIAHDPNIDTIRRLAALVEANGFAVHLNPLQELMQPEGNPDFRGVLAGIEKLVTSLEIPVIVKEVGAGLSADVVRRLLEVGVRHIDVAGAGGTSWSGVEILRDDDADQDDSTFWDWGIPTAEAVRAARPLCDNHDAVLIASGGIASPRDVAVSIALGAHFAGVARPIIRTLRNQGQDALGKMLQRWHLDLRRIMFLTGSAGVEGLREARVMGRAEGGGRRERMKYEG